MQNIPRKVGLESPMGARVNYVYIIYIILPYCAFVIHREAIISIAVSIYGSVGPEEVPRIRRGGRRTCLI